MAAPLRLLVVSSYYHPAAVYGGPVPSMADLHSTLARLGHQVAVFTTNANGTGDLPVPLGRPVPLDGLPVTYFPRWWFGRKEKAHNFFLSPALGRAVRRLRPGEYDRFLLHSVWGEPGRLAAAAARKTGTPYICHTHGSFEPWALHRHWGGKRLYLALVESGILKRAAGIVVCNGGEREALHRLGIKTPIRRLPWGVRLPREGPPSRQWLAQSWPELAGRPFLLFLSRLHPKKGLDLLLPAFAALARDFPDWLLVVAGPDEGGYRRTLERLVQDLGLGRRVLFPGLVTGPAKAALLAQAHCFVLPSYSEGFPMAAAEALGYGRPLVLTSSCYLPEVAAAGAGLEVPPERRALSAALRRMLADDRLREDCSRRARKLAAENFTWEAVAREAASFYREVG